MAKKGSTNKKPSAGTNKVKTKAKKAAPKKRGRKPSPPSAKKRLAGIRAYNLVKKNVKIFYAERGFYPDQKQLNEYTKKVYEGLKQSSKGYKKGRFRILQKTVDELLKGTRATQEAFQIWDVPFPGSDKGQEVFAFWQLAEEMALYNEMDTVTIDYSMIEDGGLRDTPTVRKYSGNSVVDAELESLEIMSEIAAYLRSNEDMFPDRYLWFERTVKGINTYLFTLVYDTSLTESTESGEFNRQGSQTKEPETKEEPEPGKKEEPEVPTQTRKIEETSALISANNREIIETIEKKTKAEENKTRVAISIKALRDIGEDVTTEMRELSDIRNSIEVYSAYIIALESENQQLKNKLK